MAMIKCPECGQEISDKAKKMYTLWKDICGGYKKKTYVWSVAKLFRR